jgi:RNA polymerase sigma factor (sigma-70 family)
MANGKAELVVRHIRMLAASGQSNKLTDRQLLERYVQDHDEEAFAALLRRHGPMILSVCRRVLGNPQDAEDAFQATFLVLARKAATLRAQETIGTWLYEVAYRLAQEARRKSFRQRVREKKASRPSHSDQLSEITARELVEVLDEELNRLAEKYRAPLVLCCLEGRSGDEAARQLACSLSTLKRRLHRGRELLHVRLTRRGLALSTAGLSTLLLQHTASASIPLALADATIKAAMSFATTGTIGAAVSAKVLALSEGVLKGMFLTKLKIAAALVMVTVLAAGVGISSVSLHGAEDDKAEAASASDDASKKKSASMGSEPANLGTVTGRVVLAADSTPVAGANVRLIKGDYYSSDGPRQKTATNERGEFTFKGLAGGKYLIVAFHGNLSSRTRMFQGESVTLAAGETTKPIVLRMQPGIAVRVKVLTEADSKPIAGAHVRPIWTDTEGDHLTDDHGDVELPALTAETWHVQVVAKGYARGTQALNLASQQPASVEFKLRPGGSVQGRVTDIDNRPIAGAGVNIVGNSSDGTAFDYIGTYLETDAEGRYHFDNLPLEQTLKLSAKKSDYLVEQPEFRIEATKERVNRVDIVLKKRPHGGSVAGVVTDSQGKAVAGADILNQGKSSDEVRRTKTDAEGKFLLENVYSDSIGHQLIVHAKGLAPQRVAFKPGPAATPSAVTIKLEPGHRIKGRVVDPAGKPIPGVQVYFAHGNTGDGIGFGGSTTTDGQGRFQFDSLPADTPFTFVADGYSQIPEIKLPLDGDQEIDVQMKSQGIIKGRVVDASTGKPLQRFTVRIIHSFDRRPDDPIFSIHTQRVYPGEQFTSAQGEFVLKDLIVGTPLQVIVLAEGYRRQVVRRELVQSAADAETLEFCLKAEDPAKLLAIRGKLVNHRGQPVRGAELRLIVATDRPKQGDDYPFNWQMIETGQIEQAPNVLQVQRLTTGADGSFLFQRVPTDAEIELVYWGKGIPSARVDHLEKSSPKELGKLEVKTLAPARITGTIDRQVFPEVGRIDLTQSTRYLETKISPDGKSFEINDLPPGQYDLLIFGPPIRTPGQPGSFTSHVIGRRQVILKEGQVETADLGKEDKVFN